MLSVEEYRKAKLERLAGKPDVRAWCNKQKDNYDFTCMFEFWTTKGLECLKDYPHEILTQGNNHFRLGIKLDDVCWEGLLNDLKQKGIQVVVLPN